MKLIAETITPIHDQVLIYNMNFEEQKTAAGIIVRSDDGKSEGIKPRWGKVWAVGQDQHDIKVNDWILIEHGRWTRGIKAETQDGTEIVIRKVENISIMAIMDHCPNDITLGLSNASTTPEFDFSQPMF